MEVFFPSPFSFLGEAGKGEGVAVVAEALNPAKGYDGKPCAPQLGECGAPAAVKFLAFKPLNMPSVYNDMCDICNKVSTKYDTNMTKSER